MSFVIAGNSASTGYNLTRSLRFRSSASAYVTRTPASSGNRQTWTWSYWIKRGILSTGQIFLGTADSSGNNGTYFYWLSADTLRIEDYSTSFVWRLDTTQVFRDPSSWYHIVLAVDTTQATAANRVKLYVNGSQVTAFSSATYPSLNYNCYMNSNANPMSIGRMGAYNSAYGDMYIAETYFIDGQALTPSSFGSTNALTGVWQPARYTGSYGTNGFYLPFTDNSALTTSSNVGLGKDFSGNGNYFTTNNISVYGGTVQSFTSSTTWTAPAGVTSVNYLVVAGGGGGGSAATGISMGGGGGAGGLLQGQLTVIPGNTYTVTVGAGGASTTNGSNSVFGSITATGGGAGAGGISSAVDAQNGGSGGGGRPYNALQKGSGISGQGFDGGSAGNVDIAGGGGGSSSVGGSVPSGTVAGSGGSGTVVNITGSNVTYAGGGGGGAYSGQTAGTGGSGGGGNGGSNADGSNATGYGSGGGGAGQYGNTHVGGSGSNGIVIIAYGTSVTYDSMTDVPTLTSATAANFGVMNPIGNGSGTISNGNLRAVTSTTLADVGTFAMQSGKWYWEVTLTVSSNPRVGMYDIGKALPTAVGMGGTNSWAIINGPSRLYYQGTIVAYGSFVGSSGSVVMIAYDPTNGNLWFGENGSWFASGNPATGASPSLTGVTGTAIVAAAGSGSGSNTFDYNFGQQPFTYTPPTGFVALNTYNLPTSTIVKGNTVMDATLWTGDGTSPRTITNAALFQPDLVWFKTRSTAFYNQLSDSVRGATKSIYSNVTLAEENNAINGYLSSINSNGFSVINGSTGGGSVNANSTTYVAWQWQAGQGSTSSNTNGTITSTVSVNASAGFSVVTYTGNGTSGATLGHGLGVAPQLIFIKSRSATGYWLVYSAVNGATKYLTLNTTDAVLTNAGPFNNTAPTSSVFSVGNSADANANSTTYVAYCWTPIAGFSAFGSYTGNGSTDGPFVYTGFRPKFVLVKNTGLASNWAIFDSTRNPYNITNFGLVPNLSDAETSGSSLQLLSNGFKWTDAGTTVNQSGATLIYMAFAENPFRNSLAR